MTRVKEIDWDRGLPELIYTPEQEEAFALARRAALASITEEGKGE